ncbi:MAG: HAMP domain-containing histidine kinase [Oscillospiraceae bacterium]|nr:HAMP domain-containing histidine kinase [Oscillospiraceae bacterium]
MKRQWHIQTRVLLTLICLTTAILLAVGLVFNLSIQSYVRTRVSSQLASVSKSASIDRKGGTKGERGGRRFDEHPDRITGTAGSAIVLGQDGELLSNLHGSDAAGLALSAYFSENPPGGNAQYQTVSLPDGKYVVSVTTDPVQDGCWLVSYVDVTAIFAFTARINIVLFAIIVAAILLSVFLSRRFSRSFAGPVRELCDFAEEIGSGNLDNRDLRFQDMEFGQLAFSMNQMAAALREANHKQETFFQNVSHELRTPLTSIRGNAEGIVCNLMEPKAAAQVILRESDKLGGMLEGILYLSRMGRASPEGTAEPLDLRDVLSLCVSEQRAGADAEGVTFLFNFDEDPVLFAIREQDAQRLFGNLISNAIRYAKAEIRLSCHASPEAVLVSVADDGPGVAPEDLGHVFERFYKGAGGKHGIGLSIAKSVVDAYHGAITVRNDGGAVFAVRFPRTK